MLTPFPERESGGINLGEIAKRMSAECGCRTYQTGHGPDVGVDHYLEGVTIEKCRLCAGAGKLLEAAKRLVNVCKLDDIYPHVKGHVALMDEAITQSERGEA